MTEKVFLLGLVCAFVSQCFGCSLLSYMVPFLHLPLVRDASCSHCFGLYTSNSLSRHVKSAHPHASLVLQGNQVALSLQVSSFPMLHLGSIPLASWGQFWAQFNFILGLFEVCFMCPQLFHKIFRTIQDEMRQAFHLPFD